MATEYTSAELLAMQRDAVKRVNEMQKISQQRLAQSGGLPPQRQQRQQQQQQRQQQQGQEQAIIPTPSLNEPERFEQLEHFEQREPQEHQGLLGAIGSLFGGGGASGGLGGVLDKIPIIGPSLSNLATGGTGVLQGFLEKLNLDSETIMILLLILLLVNEGADIMLILALGYILL